MKKQNKLKEINNLKLIFRNIRDYIAGNMTGITRDEQIAKNLMLILFCKIYDEKCNEQIRFHITEKMSDEEVKTTIDLLLSDMKLKYSSIFNDEDEIELTGDVLRYVIKKLQSYSLTTASRDIIADAFEELIGTSFRGGEGQFFTPRNVVEMIIDVLSPNTGEYIMEPACGSGGFLAYILRNYQRNICDDYHLHGIEKDEFLSKIARMYLAVLGDQNYNVFCENSLDVPKKWKKSTTDIVSLEKYDVILTNPPFGAKIPISDPDVLSQYELGHVWKKNGDKWILEKKIRDKQPPQILFLERIIQMLKPGGRAGIVLPDGMFGNPSDRYIWEYVRKYAYIRGVISLSQEAFQPSTHTKTSVLFVEKKKDVNDLSDYNIFMATAANVGHNKNGKEIYLIDINGKFILNKKGNKILNDDIPEITKNYLKFIKTGKIKNSPKGFSIKLSKIDDNIFIPEHYDEHVKIKLDELKKSGLYNMIKFSDLIKNNVVEIKRGNEIGSQFYGTGDIPFVRTSDIVNWEIKADPIKAVAQEVYDSYKNRQDVKEKDILFVNDGTFLIGRSAMVTSEDVNIIIQSHLRKIRLLKEDDFNAYYLFYLLNLGIVQQQIKNKIFTQATLSTLGNRLEDVVLPIYKDKEKIEIISKKMKQIFDEKVMNKKRMSDLYNSYNC